MKNKQTANVSNENEKEKGKEKKEAANPTWNFDRTQCGPGKSNMAIRTSNPEESRSVGPPFWTNQA